VQSLPRRYRPPLPKLERILIVDDHTPDRQRIVRALNRYYEKLKIDEAADSVEALAKLAKRSDYDLVIMDLTLQGETGAGRSQETAGSSA
jgi:CheY-like chemotaxis protein